MGIFAELCAERFGLDKAAQDAHAVESYSRAAAAIAAGKFRAEVVPVDVKGKGRGETAGAYGADLWSFRLACF